MAFSFVDRITEIVWGRRARGHFTVPRDLSGLSPCLAAEGVGQLAAWVAMAKAEFHSRPVNGVTGEARIKGSVAPGTMVDLEVEMESCESDAILYDGHARANDVPIIELSQCVGPMLPMEDFDDPRAVRERFQLLCEAKTAPQGFSSYTALSPYLTVTDRDPGKWLRAQLSVPGSAPFFSDHFPRKPVVPGTLLLDAQIELAMTLASEIVDSSMSPSPQPTRLSNVKLRSFVLPGQSLEIRVEVLAVKRAAAEMALVAESGGQRVSTARLEVGQRETP